MPLRDWFRDPIISGSTLVIACATVVNVVVSCGLWKTTESSVSVTRDIFNTANRPYVGVDTADLARNDALRELTFEFFLKNFGTAPADEFDSHWELTLNGQPVPMRAAIDKPYTLFPTQRISKRASIVGDQFDAVIKGVLVLEVTVRSSYKGPNQTTFTYCERRQYRPDRNAMMMLGAC